MLRLADDTVYRMMLFYSRQSEPVEQLAVECLIKTDRLGKFSGVGLDEQGPAFIHGALVANIKADMIEFRQMYDHTSLLSNGAGWSVKHALEFSECGGWSGVWHIEEESTDASGHCFASIVPASVEYPFSPELMEYYQSWCAVKPSPGLTLIKFH